MIYISRRLRYIIGNKNGSPEEIYGRHEENFTIHFDIKSGVAYIEE